MESPQSYAASHENQEASMNKAPNPIFEKNHLECKCKNSLSNEGFDNNALITSLSLNISNPSTPINKIDKIEPWSPLNSILDACEYSQSLKLSDSKLPLTNIGATENDYLWGWSRENLMHVYHNIPKGLEFYQIVAPPRILDDNHILESKHDLSSTQLRNDLSCPICKGILQKTVVVKNCLHRFCSDCIEKCFRIGMRECPQCRIHVPSRRSLRIDPIFDKIIHRLFTDVKAFEDKNESILIETNKRQRVRLDDDPILLKNDTELVHSRSASPSPTTNSNASPLIHRGVYVNPEVTSQPRSGAMSLTSSSECLFINDSKLSKAEKRRKRRDITNHLRKIPFDGFLSFELVPDPEQEGLPQLKNNNKLRTLGVFSVQQLSRYISHFLNVPKEQSIKFYTKNKLRHFLLNLYCLNVSPNHKYPFEPNCSLAYVHHRSYAFSHETIILYYTLRSYGDPNGGTIKGNRGYVSLSQSFISAI